MYNLIKNYEYYRYFIFYVSINKSNFKDVSGIRFLNGIYASVGICIRFLFTFRYKQHVKYYVHCTHLSPPCFLKQ